jgi:hypothetical protein
MSLSTSSANSDISKPAISMDIALVKAVLPPKRKRSRSPELELAGERLTPATCGTKESVTSKRPCVSIDTSVSSAEAHTTRMFAPEERLEALKR